MKRLVILILLCAYGLTVGGQTKPKYMWIDCEANYERMGSADSIKFYLEKLKEIGFTDVVVDVKSIMGEVLYKSDIAPFMGEWDGEYRSEGFDMMGIFIKEGHKLGMRVHASLNIFCRRTQFL